MEIVRWPEAGVPLELRRQVVALHDEAWPGEAPSRPEPCHDPALQPVSLLLVDGSRVLAALDILSKTVEHAGVTYAASGLSTVVTGQAERRRGHGLRLIVAAREEMRRGGAELAIFTCDRELAPFYEAGGYLVLPGTVLVGGTPDDPFPSDRFDKVTLWAPFSERARAQEADFQRARVELYPGTIDRLW